MRAALPLAAALFMASAMPAHPQAALLPPDPEATLVAELTVVAPTGGPAWWKVTRGESTVWILGLPPAPTPQGLKWDRSALDRRLKGARYVILPTTDWSGLHDGPQTVAVLPPATARRVEAAAALLEDPFNDAEEATVASLVYLRGAYYRYNRLNADVTPVVAQSARRAGVRVVAPQEVRYYWKPEDIDPKDPRMVGCVEGILRDVTVDPARYRTAGEAWARGDVPAAIAAAPRGAGWVCQHLFPGQWERAVAYHTDAIAQALETPGKVVAALHIPQLVAEDGVLSRLKARGYTVAEPSRPLTE